MTAPIPHFKTKDEEISYWLQEVLRHPKIGKKWPLARSRAMNHLIRTLQPLIKIAPVNHADYAEVLNDLWLWLSEHIDDYCQQPDKTHEASFKNWLNNRLGFRKLDFEIHLFQTKKDMKSLEEPVNETLIYENIITSDKEILDPNMNNLDDLVRKIQANQIQIIGFELELYIEQDPEGKLRALHLKDKSECNCQVLCQRLFLKEPKDRPRNIAREFEVPEQTLYSHCKKCKQFLQELARELGYGSEV